MNGSGKGIEVPPPPRGWSPSPMLAPHLPPPPSPPPSTTTSSYPLEGFDGQRLLPASKGSVLVCKFEVRKGSEAGREGLTPNPEMLPLLER